MKIYNRADVVNFMKVSEKFIRMQGFTEGGKSSNPSTYARRYIDEQGEREDVTGYATEISYAFDRIIENPVHDILAEIQDDELLGESVEILTVDFNKTTEDGSYEARLRTYSVIPDTAGDSTDAYTYGGRFRAAGLQKFGIAKGKPDATEVTFEENTI